MADRRLTPLPDDPRQMRRWTPPTLTATGSSMPLRAPLRSAIYVVVIGLIVASLIYFLQGVIARNQRIQVGLAEMEGAINLLNAREWEARTGVISSEHHNDVAQSQEHLRAILAELRQRTGAHPIASPTPAASGPRGTSLQQVEVDVQQYLVAVDSMFALLAHDRRRQAQTLAEQTVDPAFENLRISLAGARDYYATAGRTRHPVGEHRFPGGRAHRHEPHLGPAGSRRPSAHRDPGADDRAAHPRGERSALARPDPQRRGRHPGRRSHGRRRLCVAQRRPRARPAARWTGRLGALRAAPGPSPRHAGAARGHAA